MTLTYRGVCYDYKSILTPRSGPAFATGAYRGIPVAFYAVADSLKQPKLDLMWRGVAYSTGSTALGSSSAPAPTLTASADNPPSNPSGNPSGNSSDRLSASRPESTVQHSPR